MKWRQECSAVGTMLSCFGCENKNDKHLTRFKSKNYSWN